MFIWNGIDIIILIVGSVAALLLIGLIIVETIKKKRK